MLLKPSLAKTPIAYSPKYEDDQKKMPTHRWVLCKKIDGVVLQGHAEAQWKAQSNPRREQSQQDQQRDEHHQTSGGGSSLSPRSSGGTTPHKKTHKQSFLDHFRKSTPLVGGVQQSWESTDVQQGPFRRLLFHAHKHDGSPHDDFGSTSPHSSLNNTLQSSHGAHGGIHASTSPTPLELLRRSHGHVSPLNTIAPHKQQHLGKSSGQRTNGGADRSFYARGEGHHLHDDDGSGGGGGAEHCSIADLTVPRSLPLIYSPAPQRVTASGGAHDDGKCDSSSCQHCLALKADLDLFDSLRESKEERLYIQQLRMWKEQHDREERSKALPPDMVLTKTGQVIKRVQVMDEGPTIAQLYSGMTHQDREDLYMSACGGLSFDINREKFQKMVAKVLAPRIGVKVTDEQIQNMFVFFDVDGNGSISYFEYVTSLASKLLTTEQKVFIEDMFVNLFKMPFYPAGGKGGKATSVLDDDQTIHVLSTNVRCARDALQNPARDGLQSSSRDLPQNRSFAGPIMRSNSVLSSSTSPMSPLGGRRKSKVIGSPLRKAQDGVPQVMYLRNKHITLDRVKSVIFEMRHQNPWFPHPNEEALAASIVNCFRDLKDEHRLNVYKFRMFIFCDDECMPALELVVPGSTVQLVELNPTFDNE